MGERNGLNYSKTFPEVFIFEHSHVAKAGLMLLNKLQRHFFHEVKRKRNRRIRVILPAIEGRSGLALDCGLSPQRNTSQLILEL